MKQQIILLQVHLWAMRNVAVTLARPLHVSKPKQGEGKDQASDT